MSEMWTALRVGNGSQLRSMYTTDRPLEMTSFSVKDILNLPENSICLPKSETTLESTQCSDGNSRSSSCGPVVCNQVQECSYTSKDELDFVSLIERKVNRDPSWSARLNSGEKYATLDSRGFICELNSTASKFSTRNSICFAGKLRRGLFLQGNYSY